MVALFRKPVQTNTEEEYFEREEHAFLLSLVSENRFILTCAFLRNIVSINSPLNVI